ncbi:hypothetical protein M0802_016712, partial [Mischocyttarus mexicanus]
MDEVMEIKDHLFMEKRKKRKERSDEEELTDNRKRTSKICSQAPVSIEDNLQKEVRAYKMFESKVQLIEMEDIEFRDLQEIKTKVSGMMKLIIQLCEERKQEKKINEEPSALENRLQKFEEAIKMATESIKELKNQSGKTTSYADKLKAPAVKNLKENSNTRNRHVVAIYPREQAKAVNSDEAKKTVINTITPAKEKLQICGVKKIANKGILVETRTKEDLERVVRSEKLQAAGLKMEVPSRKKPLLIVYGVQKETTDKQFPSQLKKQNFEALNEGKLSDGVAISHRTGNRNLDTVNVVIEVSPAVREYLLRNEKVYIGWESLRIRDYLA